MKIYLYWALLTISFLGIASYSEEDDMVQAVEQHESELQKEFEGKFDSLEKRFNAVPFDAEKDLLRFRDDLKIGVKKNMNCLIRSKETINRVDKMEYVEVKEEWEFKGAEILDKTKKPVERELKLTIKPFDGTSPQEFAIKWKVSKPKNSNFNRFSSLWIWDLKNTVYPDLPPRSNGIYLRRTEEGPIGKYVPTAGILKYCKE